MTFNLILKGGVKTLFILSVFVPLFILNISSNVLAEQTCLNGEGIICDGFCYTPVLEYYACIDNEFIENPTELNVNQDVIIKINAPKSVPIDSNFDVEITFSVPESSQFPKEFTLSKVWFDYTPFAFGSYQQIIDVNKKYTLAPGEEIKEKVSLKSAQYKSVTGRVLIQTFGATPKSTQVNVYYTDLPTGKCGERTYNLEDALCKDGILYPIGMQTSKVCSVDSDCQEGTCFQNICLKRNEKLTISEDNNIPVVILFLNKNPLTDEAKKKILEETSNDLARANRFFIEEKNAWGSQSENSFTFYLEECPAYNREFYLKDIEDSFEVAELESKIASTCQLEGYPIIYYFVRDSDDEEIISSGNKFNLPVSAGLNFGDYVFLGRPTQLDSHQTLIFFSTLIHEALHSFGAFDIYYYKGEPGGFYQWNNCVLFTAKWEEFEKNPRLCGLEAYVIGFTDNDDFKRIETNSQISNEIEASSSDVKTNLKDSPLTLIFWLVVGTFVFLIILVILLIAKKSKQSKANQSGETIQS